MCWVFVHTEIFYIYNLSQANHLVFPQYLHSVEISILFKLRNPVRYKHIARHTHRSCLWEGHDHDVKGSR